MLKFSQTLINILKDNCLQNLKATFVRKKNGRNFRALKFLTDAWQDFMTINHDQVQLNEKVFRKTRFMTDFFTNRSSKYFFSFKSKKSRSIKTGFSKKKQ